MRNYELAIIVEPNIDEEGVTSAVDGLSQHVKSLDGEVASVDLWGRKTLAYPINKYREGTYVLFNLKLNPSKLVDLERNLKLSEQIIRYMLIVEDDDNS